ncbi:MAG: hypothetical protein ACI4TT_01410, partial [Christensenellales bacterium]
GILKGAAVFALTGPAGLAVYGAAKGMSALGSKLGKTKVGKAVKGGVSSFARGTGRVFKTMRQIAGGNAKIGSSFNAVSGKGKAWESESQINAKKAEKELKGQIDSTKDELSDLENSMKDYEDQMEKLQKTSEEYKELERLHNDTERELKIIQQKLNRLEKK